MKLAIGYILVCLIAAVLVLTLYDEPADKGPGFQPNEQAPRRTVITIPTTVTVTVTER